MIQFTEIVLDNGLTVVLSAQKNTSLVAVNMLYNVGSSAENPTLTGQAHFLEHMMFTGTPAVPDYDTIIQNCGGENNAYTTKDYTNLFAYGPSVNLETLLFLEADRMENLTFEKSKFSSQKNIILEEYNESVLSTPLGSFWDHLGQLMYPDTSYEWSTIGKNKEDIAKTEITDLQNFYKKLNPKNAFLSVVGNINEKETITLIEKIYGPISKNGQIQSPSHIQAKPTSKKSIVNDPLLENNCFYLFYPVPNRSSDEYYAMDLICDVLSLGKKSRFYAKFLEKDTEFASLNAWVSDTTQANLLVIEGKVYPQYDIDISIAKIKDEVASLVHGGVSQEELNRVKNKTMTNIALSDHSILNRAMNFSFYSYLNDTNLINRELEIYKDIDLDIIHTLAKQYLGDESETILIFTN